MKKKVTNEEVGKAIGKMAEAVRSEMDYDLRVAKSQMAIAEIDLVSSLNEEQKKLYDNFCKKRDAFFNLAREVYKRKY